MATPLIRVEGGRAQRKALKQVEDGLADLKEAHKRLGREAAEDIKAALPSKSGAWKAAIKDQSTTTMAKVIWGREGKGKGIVYAGWQEFGGKVLWKSRGNGPAHIATYGIVRNVRVMRIELPRVPDGRYVYPTAEANVEKYVRLHGEYVGGLLRKAGLT